MYYLRARYYKPDTGRFWTMDSFEGSQTDPLSLHKYLYGHNDPLNNLDPTGQKVIHAARNVPGLPVPGLQASHQFIILQPDNPADFEGSSAGGRLLQNIGYEDARLLDIEGKKVIIVGATPKLINKGEKQRLVSQFFNSGDLEAARTILTGSSGNTSDLEGYTIAAPGGKSDSQFIMDVLSAVQNYGVNENVCHIYYPRAATVALDGRDPFNSNSFASSVLHFVGAQPWQDFLGWTPNADVMIPDDYFTAGGVKPGKRISPTLQQRIKNLPFLDLSSRAFF